MNITTLFLISLFCISLLIASIVSLKVSKILSLVLFVVLASIALSYSETFMEIDNPLNGQKAKDIQEKNLEPKKVEDLKLEEKRVSPVLSEEGKLHLEKLDNFQK